MHPTHLGIWPDPTQIYPNHGAKLKITGPLPPAEIAEAAPRLTENSRFHYKLDQYVHTLQLNLDLDDFLLTSVTGLWDYRHREFTNYGYTSWAVVVSKQGESGEAFTQELRLASTLDGPVNFTVGGFYEKTERDLQAPVQLVPSGFFNIVLGADVKHLAAPGAVPGHLHQLPPDLGQRHRDDFRIRQRRLAGHREPGTLRRVALHGGGSGGYRRQRL